MRAITEGHHAAAGKDNLYYLHIYLHYIYVFISILHALTLGAVKRCAQDPAKLPPFLQLCRRSFNLSWCRPYPQPGEGHIFHTVLRWQCLAICQICWIAISCDSRPNQGISSLKRDLHSFSFSQVWEERFTAALRRDVVQLQHDRDQTLAAEPKASVISGAKVAPRALGRLSVAISD